MPASKNAKSPKPSKRMNITNIEVADGIKCHANTPETAGDPTPFRQQI